MIPPGTRTGPMQLPASYTQDQLKEFGWNDVLLVFERTKGGPWGSRVEDNHWGGQAPRRRPSHYKTKDEKHDY